MGILSQDDEKTNPAARGPSKNLQKTVQQNSEELALTVAMNGPLGDVKTEGTVDGTWLEVSQ